jgi:hypothetical protein
VRSGEAAKPPVLRLEGESREEAQLKRWSFLLRHLKDRKVVQWMLGYVAAGWMILQLMDVLSEIWYWPVAVQRTVCLWVGLGLFPALVIAWCLGLSSWV